jgi:hypothetical protein
MTRMALALALIVSGMAFAPSRAWAREGRPRGPRRVQVLLPRTIVSARRQRPAVEIILHPAHVDVGPMTAPESFVNRIVGDAGTEFLR